jgi:hypothetical protein
MPNKLSIEVSRNGQFVEPGQAANEGRRPLPGGIGEFDVESIVADMRDSMMAVGEAFKPVPGGPEASEIKFGMKVGANGKVFIASLNGEVTLEVKLTWKRET